MKTSYVNASLKTLKMMRSLLDLFPNRELESHPVPIIAHNFTKGQSSDPEPVLNMTWSLGGEWKTVPLVKFFENNQHRAWGMLNELLELSRKEVVTHDEFRNRLHWLYNSSEAKKPKVSGRDYRTGITDLFKALTVQEKITPGTSRSAMLIPVLIIRKTGTEEHKFYDLYFYSHLWNEKRFVHVTKSNEVRFYVMRAQMRKPKQKSVPVS